MSHDIPRTHLGSDSDGRVEMDKEAVCLVYGGLAENRGDELITNRLGLFLS